VAIEIHSWYSVRPGRSLPGPASPAADVAARAVSRAAADVQLAGLLQPYGHGRLAVHHARVAVRRLRSTLLTFAPLLEPDTVTRGRDLFKPVGTALAGVRATDVVLVYLARAMSERPRPEPGVPAVTSALLATRAAAYEALRAELTRQADAHAIELRRLTHEPPHFLAAGPDAVAPAREIMPALLRRTWRLLKDASRGPAPDLDAVRVWARHCRYAAEATAPVLGPPVAALAASTAELHKALGDVNHAAVITAWLDGDPLAAQLPPRVVRRARELAAENRAWAEAVWPDALERVLAARRVSKTPSSAAPLRAAGGVVWRPGAGGIEVVLIHRTRHDDWSLPKGAAAPDETFAACAQREVEEETGLRCVLGAELPAVMYRNQDGRRKVVQYFAMRPAGGCEQVNAEVDAIVWLPLDEARVRVTRGRDRRVLDALRSALT